MRLSFCFAAMIVAPYAATSSHAQAPVRTDAPVAASGARETPQPTERVRDEPAPIDPARVIKRTLEIGNRKIMVDQFVGA